MTKNIGCKTSLHKMTQPRVQKQCCKMTKSNALKQYQKLYYSFISYTSRCLKLATWEFLFHSTPHGGNDVVTCLKYEGKYAIQVTSR